MEQRVRDLERRMDRVEGRLDWVAHEIAQLRAEVAARPTTSVMVTAFVGIALGVIMLVFGIARVA